MKIQASKEDTTLLNNIKCELEEAQTRLNAIVTICDIEEQVHQLSSDTSKPLYRCPVALKDNFNTKGIRTTASSRILDNYVPVYDATVTKKLKAAGAVIVAKTSLDELGMGGTNLTAYTGKVNNPWDLSRITGGSSGGSAALVADGIVPVALGSDTGDSVRKPAAYCGIVGFKPTYGRISRYGVIPYASSLDTVGYFTTNVEDAALTLEVLAGRDDHDLTSSNKPVEAYHALLNSDLQGKRIAVLKNVQDAIVNKDILDNFNQLCEKMEAQGAIVETVSMDDLHMRALLPTYYIIANAEATANHANLDGIRFGVREDGETLSDVMLNSRTKGFGLEVKKRFVIGAHALAHENQELVFKKAQRVRRVIVDAYQTILNNYDVVIACATSSVASLPEKSFDDTLDTSHLIAENHMILGNFSGFPSITIPSGMVDGLPIGVNISAKPFDEVNLLSVAKGIENITGLAGLCRKGAKA